MEIYLDANATTPVLPQASAAAMSVMSDAFGNPSSIHGSGLKARAVLDQARNTARRVLDAPDGRLLFTSGATEGIQTSVLSALADLRQRRDRGEAIPSVVLYGATEHKAVPEAVMHWNSLLGLNLQVLAIPVSQDGRHDLGWLRQHVARAGLVCTMAANNETGVISDLDGIAAVLAGSPALWLVDGVQALGKLPLRLRERGIDYAPFSGHKLYAPKGVGMLYVRAGAPFTPLMAGGGQEGALRSGTENMAGIAALGAVLAEIEKGEVFANAEQLDIQRLQLADALRSAFPGVVFNAPFETSLPTTLNISVPGLAAPLLLDLLDAGGVRASGGSACGAAKARPSHVLEAMGLPEWRAASAVRLSFGTADRPEVLAEACRRLKACGESLRASCQIAESPLEAAPVERVTRFVVAASCCYLLCDADTRHCVVIDPLPELTDRLARWLRCRGCTVAGILDTHGHGDHASSASALRTALADILAPAGEPDALGWPQGAVSIDFGAQHLTRLAVPGHTRDSTVYLAHDASGLHAAFVGDTVMPGALGRSDFPVSEPLAYAASLLALEAAVGCDALLLPGHDYDNRFATTLKVERTAQPLLEGVLGGRLDAQAFAAAKSEMERDLPPTEFLTMACGARIDCDARAERVELTPAALSQSLAAPVKPIVVDVREDYEERMSPLSNSLHILAPGAGLEVVPLSVLVNQLPRWNALAAERPLVFCCRSGNRSAQAARALRRLGHTNAWSLAGGLALLPAAENRHDAADMAA